MKAIRTSVQIVAVILGILTGCMAQNKKPQVSDLLGTWKSGTLQTEWGPSILEVTFRDSSNIEFKMIPVEGAEGIVNSGNYRLNGSQLISEAINKGSPVSIWLDSNQLVIQAASEPPKHFTRK